MNAKQLSVIFIAALFSSCSVNEISNENLNLVNQKVLNKHKESNNLNLFENADKNIKTNKAKGVSNITRVKVMFDSNTSSNEINTIANSLGVVEQNMACPDGSIIWHIGTYLDPQGQPITLTGDNDLDDEISSIISIVYYSLKNTSCDEMGGSQQ